MAIEAKAILLNRLEKDLSHLVTAADMATVLSLVADHLTDFDLQQIEKSYMPENDDMLEAFASALATQGRSQKTIDRYKYILNRMRKAVNLPTRQITVYHLRKYLADEKDRGISDRTLEGNRQVIALFFKWLHQEGLLDRNPCANLGTIRCKKKIKQIYSDTDMARLQFACKTLRDHAIVMFLQSTGCRISEMTQLNRDDVDFVRLECNVLGKGNKERTIYMSSVAAMVLKEYLNSRTDNYEALFIGKGSSRMTPHGVRFMLTNLAERARVEHCHPHKFRRTLATNLIRHGMPIQEVAAVLGHEKLDTTMEYVVLDKQDIKHSYSKYA